MHCLHLPNQRICQVTSQREMGSKQTTIRCLLLAWPTVQPWRWRQWALPKLWWTSATSHYIPEVSTIHLVTAVRTSNPTSLKLFFLHTRLTWRRKHWPTRSGLFSHFSSSCKKYWLWNSYIFSTFPKITLRWPRRAWGISSLSNSGM
jgi:hypothetical protein